MIEVGSHARVRRRVRLVGVPYWHHGIMVGPGELVEFGSGNLWTKRQTQVRRTTLRAFAKGAEAEAVRHPITWSGVTYSPLLPPDQVADRAEWLVSHQPPPYQLGFRNCESIAIWCATGDYESFQVKRFMRGRVLVTLALLPLARRRPKLYLALAAIGLVVSLLTAFPYNINRKFYDHTRQYPGIGEWDRDSPR